MLYTDLYIFSFLNAMRLTVIFILSILFTTSIAFGQTRTITGKVIDENFYPVYEARINVDTSPLVTTDTNGIFKIEIPVDTKSISIGSIGMEWKSIDLTGNCSNLEIILLNSATYDFMSARKIDRLRKKDFDKLPTIHQTAFEKGIFKMAKPCYTDKFAPIKNRLKQIHKRRTLMPST